MYIYLSCTQYSPHIIIKILFQNFWDFSTCNGLVINSTVVASVGQYLIPKFLFFTWSARKIYIMFKCPIPLIGHFFLFSCSRIILLLSWYLKIGQLCILVLPEKYWSIILEVTRHPHLLTWLLCLFLCSIFFVSRIWFILFPLLMLLLYAI